MPGYTYPGSDAVKNKLGARDHAELERREAPLVAMRRAEIEAGAGPPRTLDGDYLKALHRHLFQDVFEWAGHTRDERFRLSDGAIATEPVMRKLGGKPILAGARIAAALNRMAKAIRAGRNLTGLSHVEFAVRGADVLADINAIHAFREGNGRVQRSFLRELAKAAGHDLDFSATTRERMLQASIASNEGGDRSPMIRLFADALVPARRDALRKAIESLGSFSFAWNDHYIATAEPGHRVELILVGVAGAQFMARSATAILVGRTADLPSPTPRRGKTFTLDPTPWDPTDDRVTR